MKRPYPSRWLAFAFTALLCGGCGHVTIGGGPGNYDFFFPLAGSYELSRTASDHISISDRDRGEVVPHEVMLVAVQGNIITVEQWTKPYGVHHEGGSGQHFWIIEASKRHVQGPLEKEDYLVACKRLAIDPDNMKSVEYYHEQAQQAAAQQGRP